MPGKIGNSRRRPAQPSRDVRGLLFPTGWIHATSRRPPPRGTPLGSGSPASVPECGSAPPEQPEQDRKHQAQQQRRHQREVKDAVPAPDDDVARQPAQPDRQPRKHIKKKSGEKEGSTQDHQASSKLADHRSCVASAARDGLIPMLPRRAGAAGRGGASGGRKNK